MINETLHTDAASDERWPSAAPRVPVPDTSMLSGTETAAPAAVDMLKNAAQGAHDTIDRLAEGAAPAVQQFGESVAAAGDALHAKSDQLRELGDEWAENLRTTVRGNPLAAIAAALVLGAVIARIAR